MRRSVTALALLALLVAAGAALASGCGGSGGSDTGSSGLPGTVATVAGVDITGTQVQELIRQASVQLEGSGEAFPAKGTAQYDEYMAKMVEYLVGNQIILSSAKDLGLNVTDASVDAQIKELVSTYGGQKKFEATLKASGMTQDLLKRTIKSQLLSQAAQSAVTKAATVSDADVRSYWDAHAAEFKKNAETRTFAKAKDSIETMLLNAARQHLWNQWLSERTRQLGVSYADGFDPAVLKAHASAQASPSPSATP